MAEVCAIACILCVIFMFLGAISKSNPKKQEMIKSLLEKGEAARKELIKISIEQTIWLNSNLKAGNISVQYYSEHIAKVAGQFERCGFSPAIIGTLPTVHVSNARELLIRQLKVANQLDDLKQLTLEEFDTLINESLDGLKDIKPIN